MSHTVISIRFDDVSIGVPPVSSCLQPLSVLDSKESSSYERNLKAWTPGSLQQGPPQAWLPGGTLVTLDQWLVWLIPPDQLAIGDPKRGAVAPDNPSTMIG